MDPDNPLFGPDNSKIGDEFYFRPKLRSLLFDSPCMKFEGEGGGGEAVSVVDAEGNFTEGWENSYDEADRPTLSRHKSLPDFVKSHMNLRRKFNKDPDALVEIPSKDSSEEVRAEFHKRRGVPDKAEDYKYEQPDNIQCTFKNDEEKAHYFQLAKSANLTPTQFKIIVDEHFTYLDKALTAKDLIDEEANHKANTEADAALTKKFGKAKEERVARANAIMRHYGGAEAVAALKFENNPLMVEFIDNIAEDMSEDRIKGITTTTIATTAALDNRIVELRNHPAYNLSSHPEHKKVQAEVQELYKQRYPD